MDEEKHAHKNIQNPWMNLTSQIIQSLDKYMLEMSYPKMNKKLSSLWTRDNASYKSNLWMNKASKRNTIHRRVILRKHKEW